VSEGGRRLVQAISASDLFSFFPALSIVSLCAYVHAHSHYTTTPAPPPSTASSTKAGAGGGPHVPINWLRTGNSVHDRSGRRQLYPVPISRDHREESGGSCARPSTGGQRPPCSMRHTALAPLGGFPPAAKSSRWVACQWNPHNPRGALWDAPGGLSCSLLPWGIMGCWVLVASDCLGLR
jgi:hypothetical protein